MALDPAGEVPGLVLSQCTLEPPLPQTQVGLQVRAEGVHLARCLATTHLHLELTPCSLNLPRVEPVAMTLYCLGFPESLSYRQVSLKLFPGNYAITYCQKMDAGFCLNHDQLPLISAACTLDVAPPFVPSPYFLVQDGHSSIPSSLARLCLPRTQTLFYMLRTQRRG